jgi:hypothetical protein
MTASHIRCAAAGALALCLSLAAGPASAGCRAGCIFVAPQGHYPTIFEPTALYRVPPPLVRRSHSRVRFVEAEPHVAYAPVTHVEMTTILAPVAVLRPVRAQRLVTRYRPVTVWDR